MVIRMKKEDDFFRITFRREEDVIKRFEQNIGQLTGGGISRPLLVATICNYFFEQGYGVMWKNGAWEIVEPTKDNPKERSSNTLSQQQTIEVASLNKRDSTVTTASHPFEATEEIYGKNLMDDENEEMLRSMGLA